MSQADDKRYHQELLQRQAESDQRKRPLSADQVASLTIADVETYSSDEYLVHLKTTVGFAARVDELEKTRRPRPTGR